MKGRGKGMGGYDTLVYFFFFDVVVVVVVVADVEKTNEALLLLYSSCNFRLYALLLYIYCI
ncbi:hypothetical protein CC80DRAFT_225860 [Byssothecium circinans]|uniref:Uncharacterized protein n=1 Tax=Byssothecium circinans TaxID=147558 RepID=A0A6A5TIV4_9PLEO|nr:hypothetical protein CC80DRAFT_225860 [Byssothecium circinans]